MPGAAEMLLMQAFMEAWGGKEIANADSIDGERANVEALADGCGRGGS